MLGDLAVLGVLGFVAVRLTQGVVASRQRRGRVGEIVRGIGWRHLWPVPLVLTAVLATALTLLRVPGLDWGWWQALGGDGNPAFGRTERTAGTALDWLIPLVFLVLLIPALPLFAEAEERRFRSGAERWSRRRRLWMCCSFGLVHALVGIPLGVALALSVGGAYFMWCYLRAGGGREGLLESTRAHTTYNAVVVMVVLVAVVQAALTGEPIS